MTIIKADGDDDIYLSRFKDLGRGGDDGNIICSTHTAENPCKSMINCAAKVASW